MIRCIPWLVGLGMILVGASASAFNARDTADVKAKGEWSVGVFNPLSVSPQEGVELEVHPLLFFTAPHLQARFAHGDLGVGEWRFSSLVGLWFPYPALTSGPPLGLVGFFVRLQGRRGRARHPAGQVVPGAGLDGGPAPWAGGLPGGRERADVEGGRGGGGDA